MGVRPKVYTVFGLDNWTGSLEEDVLSRPVIVTDEMITQDKSLGYIRDRILIKTGKRDGYCEFWDFVFVGDREAVKNIIGWKVSEDFDSDTFRVLSMLYPEFYTSGYRDVPLLTNEGERRGRMHRSQVYTPSKEIPFQPDKWFYPMAYHEMAPTWAYITKWFLDQVGVETNPLDYKWMLVWEWS